MKYAVKQGDTLWGVAQKQLNDIERYTEIVRLNGLKTATLTEGMKLQLPEGGNEHDSR